MNLLSRILAMGSLLVAAHSFAASPFEGKVTFSMTPEKGKPMDLNYSTKGQKIRTDMEVDGTTVSSIMDGSKMEMTMLMPEQKMYMVMPIKQAVESAMAKQGEANVDIEVTGKTEKILGYQCEQILVKDKDKGITTEMWVAKDLGSFMGLGSSGGSPFGGPKKAPATAKWEEALKGRGGFPLRVISHDKKNKVTFKMEATKVAPGPLPDSLFVPPPDFQKFQMPDFGGLNPFKQR